MSKAIICTVSDRTRADAIVRSLSTAGFAATDISVLFPDKTGTRDFAHEHGTKAPEGAVTGAVAGGEDADVHDLPCLEQEREDGRPMLHLSHPAGGRGTNVADRGGRCRDAVRNTEPAHPGHRCRPGRR